MCFDQPSSLAALGVGLAAAGAAYAYRYTVLSVLIAVVALMQLSEFLIWRGLDTGSLPLNRAGTALARTTLGMHGLAVCLAALVFAMPDQRWRRAGLVLCTLAAFAMYGLIVDGPHGLTTRAGCASGCRLKWAFPVYPDTYKAMCAILFLALLLSRVPPRQTLCIFAFYGLTLALAYATAKPSRLWEAVSTSWCYACSIGAPLLIATLVALRVPPDPNEEADPPSYNVKRSMRDKQQLLPAAGLAQQ